MTRRSAVQPVQFAVVYVALAAWPVGLPVYGSPFPRGGSWDDDRDNARAANRDRNNPNNRNNTIGFRVVPPGRSIPVS